VIDRTLLDWGLAAVFLPVLGFALDWLLTHLGAAAYRAVAGVWSVEGSYELNPRWQPEVDAGRRLSPRLLLTAAAMLALLVVLWQLCLALGGYDTAILGPEPGQAAFGFAVGALLLVQAPTVMSHAANLAQFRALADPTAVSGGLRVRRWVAYRQSSGMYLRFAALWLALAILSLQGFFAGGVFGCLSVALRFRRLGEAARRNRRCRGDRGTG
jgi:hypothetical protein